LHIHSLEKNFISLRHININYYIDIIYFHDVETNIRYPTENNNYSLKNDFNNKNNLNVENLLALNFQFLILTNNILMKI
jgi:hypothetical protein